MPNPDFTGDVPHRRCETCVHWLRMSVSIGECDANTIKRVLGDSMLVQRTPVYSLDLAVCSNWSAKAVEDN